MDVSSIGNRDGLILKELRKAHFARALRLLFSCNNAKKDLRLFGFFSILAWRDSLKKMKIKKIKINNIDR